MSLKINNISAVSKDMRRYVVKNNFPSWLREATELALPKIRLAFKKAYRQTDFSRGLKGRYPFDLDRDVQAILGFYPTEVDGIDDKISDILGDALKFSKFVTRNDNVYFQLTSENMKDFLSQEYPDGSYETKTSSTVDWLDWILYGGHVNADLIIDAKFDESRSERGLMLNIGNGDWRAEDYEVFPASAEGGFIKELLDSDDFKNEAALIITEKFRKVVKG